MKADTVASAPLPAGPPLHLERAGAATEHLAAFLLPERLERMQRALDHRTRRLTALVEDIHDPHNVAACVRSCDAFGVQDLHIVRPGGDPLLAGRDVSRGAQRWLTVRYHEDAAAAVHHLHAGGYLIAATDLGGDVPPVPLPDVPLDAPLCVAFGNEHTGISPTLRALCDLRVRVPMHGFVESLNISVAFAVTMYTLRQALDARAGAAGDLTGPERAVLLDRWILDDVPHARAVLAELARRHATLPDGDTSG